MKIDTKKIRNVARQVGEGMGNAIIWLVSQIQEMYQRHESEAFEDGERAAMVGTVSILLDLNLEDEKILGLLYQQWGIGKTDAKKILAQARNVKHENQ